MNGMRRVWHLLCLGVGITGAWSVAQAHPIHTTMSTVTIERGHVTLRIRAFADDLSASVAAYAGKSVPADWSMAEADVVHYLRHTVRVTHTATGVLPVQSCGVTRERDVYWLCVRVTNAVTVAGLQLVNRMLVERHDDQVNIVHVNAGSTRRTLLFTKGSDYKSM